MLEVTRALPSKSHIFKILAVSALLMNGQMKCFADPIVDRCLVLSAPVWTNHQIQLTLNCESGVTYLLQSSPDLQHWNSILTNSDPSISRTFNFAAPDTLSFYRVSRNPLPLFAYAIGAQINIVLNGNGLTTDSYSSADTNLSTNGQYDPTRFNTNGDIACFLGSVQLGNHSIRGNVLLGPSATFGPDESQVLGKILQNFNTCFPDPIAPDSSTWPPAPILNTNIDGVTYQYAFFDPTNDFTITNSGNTFFVSSNANVRLMLTSPSCSLSIRIAGSGLHSGSLKVYQLAGGATMFQSLIDDGNTANCAYIGLSAVTNLTLNSIRPYSGTIYAPSANVTAFGAGAGPGFMGSCIVKSLVMDGHFLFHFDENLLMAGPQR